MRILLHELISDGKQRNLLRNEAANASMTAMPALVPVKTESGGRYGADITRHSVLAPLEALRIP